MSQAGPEKGSLCNEQCGLWEAGAQRAGFLWGCNISQCWLERPGRARPSLIGVGLIWQLHFLKGRGDTEEAGADLSNP